MEINRTNPGLTTIPVTTSHRPITLAVSATANIQLQQWKSGQTLEAMIVQISNTQAKLKLGGITLTINDPLVAKMRAGQIISVKIEQAMPDPKLTLLIPNTDKLDMINQAIRQKLPQQQDLSLVLSKLTALVSKTDTVSADMRNQLQQNQTAILKSIPVAPNNLATELKNHINNAAVFSHNLIQQHLTNNRNFPANNIHIQLLRLSGIIRSMLSSQTTPATPGANTTGNTVPHNFTYDAQGKLPLSPAQTSSTTPTLTQAGQQPAKNTPAPGNQYLLLDELLKASDGALAKIQTQQLQMLRSDDTSNPTWLFELPLKQGKNTDVFEFLIQRDSDTNQNEYQKTWQVQLKFNLQGLGEILAIIKLRENSTIDVSFISENKHTVNLFKKHLDTLISKLETNGINPGNLSSEYDSIPQHMENTITQQTLIEDKI